MRDTENIKAIAELQPDYMGFIFYEKSPRAVEVGVWSLSLSKCAPSPPKEIKTVGVFVNESVEKMRETAQKYKLYALQLHGGETPLQCCSLQDEFTVIKAFSIAGAEDFQQTEAYEGCCDYFLFDTKTHTTPNPSPQERVVYGGSGTKFDWSLLDNYKGKTPFFLSGGIDLDDVTAIKKIKHPQFFGVDINSRFETNPGMKDIEKVKQFIQEINL